MIKVQEPSGNKINSRKDKAASQKRQAKMKQWYKYPADDKKAQIHRDSYRLGALQRQQEDSCPCCQQKIVKNEHSLCQSPENIAAQKYHKTVQIYLYFTFVKGLIIFLALRFLCFDSITIFRSMYGSYCSELFKTRGKVCTYVLSPYNLKGQLDIDLHLDQFNALFNIFSILYFATLKYIIYQGRKQLKQENIEEQHYSLLVSNFPSFIMQNYEQLKQKTKSLFEHLQKLKQDKKSPSQYDIKIIQQEQLLTKKQIVRIRQSKVDSFSIAQSQQKFQEDVKRVFLTKIHEIVSKNKKKLSYIDQNKRSVTLNANAKDKLKLFNQIDMQIVPQLTLIYDLSSIMKVAALRSNIQFLTSEELFSKGQKEALVDSLTQQLSEMEAFLYEKYINKSEKGLHISQFSGKLIISFQYKLFRDQILKAYQHNPAEFQINGQPLVIQPAPKPTDICWQNLSESEQKKRQYSQHSWVVMIMMLVLSFAAFTLLELMVRDSEIITTVETPWLKFKRIIISLISGLTATIINKLLGYQIDVLVEMEKHATKSERQKSFIIKSILAQTFNSLFIYMIIYTIHHDNPLGPYGLAEKVISLAIVSNLTTLFFQTVRPTRLLWDIKTSNFFGQDENHQPAKQKSVLVRVRPIQVTEKPDTNDSLKEELKKYQIQLNRQYEYPKFEQQGMYISYTLMIFLVSFYGFLAPTITLIVLASFIVLYWVDKYNAFRRSSLDSFDDSRGDLILVIIQLSFLLSTISYFMWNLRIQKDPQIKPLNLLSILLALQFAGFQVLIKTEVKQRIQKSKKDFKKYENLQLNYQQSYKQMVQTFEHTYKNQYFTTKYIPKIYLESKPKLIQKPINDESEQDYFEILSLQVPDSPLIIQQRDRPHFPMKYSYKIEYEGERPSYQYRPARIQQDEGFSVIFTHVMESFSTVASSIFDILVLALFATTFIVSYTIYLSVLIALSPAILAYAILRNIYHCRWSLVFNLTLLLPVTAVRGLIYMTKVFLNRFTQFRLGNKIINSIVSHTFTIKHKFYRKKTISFEQSKLKIHSTITRICFFLVSLLLLPILFLLSNAIFIASTILIFCFTLILLPAFVSTQRKVDAWLPIVFYPVMLVYYFGPIYFGSFFWPCLKDLVTFYLYYIKVMFCYMLCNRKSDDK